MTHENAQDRTLSDAETASEGQAAPGARGSLVERLAEAMAGGADRLAMLARVNPGEVVNVSRNAEAVLPLVAAEVEAAVSVVRAERDEAREEVRARDDDAALEVERVKRGARELGRILDQTLHMALDISGRQDVIDADGDGDWGLIWETLAELRPRAESAESDLWVLREKVARVEAEANAMDAMADELPTEASGLRLGARSIRAALSDPTTPDQPGAGCGCLSRPESADLPWHESSQHGETTARTRLGSEVVDALMRAHGVTTPDQKGGEHRCICNDSPVAREVICRLHPTGHLLNCPVCGSGEEGACICDIAEAFAEAEWNASGKAIYESPWEQVSPMKKQHLKVEALPEAHDFLAGHTEGQCRPELCGGSKVDPCGKATR